VPAAQSRYLLSVISGGAKGQRFAIPTGSCAIGRNKGAVLFPDDVTLSPHHATLLVREGRLFIRDEGTPSGIFVRISGPENLAAQTQFTAGERLFRFLGPIRPHSPPAPGEKPIAYGAPFPPGDRVFAVEEILMGGRPGRVVLTGAPLLSIGKHACDFTYPQDAHLSLRHCELTPTQSGVVLRDTSDGGGTFVRLAARAERALVPGDTLRVGFQVFRIENNV
jgi:pSer/pThr/pTyr-binding forkhead associated (FHA) protein